MEHALDEFLKSEGRTVAHHDDQTTVIFGTDHHDRHVALRICHDTKSAPSYAFNEHHIGTSVGHPCLIETLNSKVYTSDKGNVIFSAIVTPRARGDMVQLFEESTFDERFGWMKSAAEGMWALHRLRVIHSDIKPDNLFIYEDGARLADLGHSVWMVNPRPVRRGGYYRQTYTCRSPEYMVCKESYPWHGEPSDVWAWGATLWFAIYGHSFIPFRNDEPDRIYRWMKKHLMKRIDARNKPDDMSDEMWSLVDRVLAGTLEWDPFKRWTSEQLIRELGIAPREPVSRFVTLPQISDIPVSIRNELINVYFQTSKHYQRMPEFLLRLAAAFRMQRGCESTALSCIGLALCLSSSPSFCDNFHKFHGSHQRDMLRVLDHTIRLHSGRTVSALTPS